jgi:WD40 repeat protein
MQKGRLTGKTVGGYSLLKLLGAGAVGSVYQGYQREQDLHAAVKILSPIHIDIHPHAVDRFLLEAKTVASLQHPHIVQIYDYGRDEEHRFIAMQLLTGGTLEERLNFYLSQSQFPSLSEVAQLLQQLASALTYAHHRQIIHRDVKSSNVMFDAFGTAYLVDFGLVKLLDGSPPLTSSNVVLGTPAYMSPEQWLGNEITPATDQYALGSLVYLLLTGVLPFNATSLQTSMYQQVNAVPEPIHVKRKEIPEVVSNVVQWALAKDPQDRYPTANTFAETFNNAIQGFEQTPTGFFTFSLHSTGTTFLRMSPISETVFSEPPTTQLDISPTEIRSNKVPKRSTSKVLFPLSIVIGVGILLLGIGVLATLLGVFTFLRPEATASALLAVLGSSTQSTSPTSTLLALSPMPSPTQLESTNTVFESQITAANAVQVQEIRVIKTKNTSVRSVAFHPEGSRLATGGNSHEIQIWEPLSGQSVMTLSGHQEVIYSLAYSHDGGLLASASGDGTVSVWNAETGQELYRLTGHSGEVRQVIFSPDDTVLISVGQDQTIRAWDIQRGTPIEVIQGGNNRILCAVFSPDGSHLATSWSVSDIALWDSSTFVQQRTLSGHVQEVRSLDFNAEGTRLASGSIDNTIRIWNVQTGMMEMIITENDRNVFDIAFNSDSSLLASGGADNMIHLWDSESGTQLTQLQGHTGWVFEVRFAQDGSLLASASGDGTVRVWGFQ